MNCSLYHDVRHPQTTSVSSRFPQRGIAFFLHCAWKEGRVNHQSASDPSEGMLHKLISCNDQMFTAKNLVSNFDWIERWMCTVYIQGNVQIDESVFGKKKKYGRGCYWKRMLVFGICGQEGAPCVLRRILTPSKKEIFPIIFLSRTRACCARTQRVQYPAIPRNHNRSVESHL